MCPYGFDIYLVKTIRRIAQIFVAFSEKLNFTVWYVNDGARRAASKFRYSEKATKILAHLPLII